MEIDRRDTALVYTDPQNEVLSETGLAWPLVRESLAENNTIENMDRLFAAAKQFGFQVFSRHTTSTRPTPAGSSTAPSRRTRRRETFSVAGAY